jgi:hypothetical protein
MAIFQVNEHKVERIARVVLGVALISLFFFGPETPWGLLGFVPLLTGAVGFCPLYRIFGFSTCSDCEPDATQA